MNRYIFAFTVLWSVMLIMGNTFTANAQPSCECNDTPRPKRFTLLDLNALTKEQQASTSKLLQILSYPEAEKRAVALRKLGQTRDTTVVSSIILKLDDTDCVVKTEAAVALGYFKSTEISIALAAKKSDLSCTVREEIAYQLANYSGSASAKEALIFLSKDHERNVVSQAVRSLANFYDVALIPQLKEHLESNDSKVRTAAVEALSVYRNETVGGWLCNALSTDTSKHVRQAAAYALMHYNSKVVMETLLKALDDRSEHVQQGAVESLAAIGDKSAFEPILKKLESKNAVLRHVALASAVKLGDQRAIPYLNKALSDESKVIRNFAKRALSQNH